MISSACESTVAYLSGLKEVSIVDQLQLDSKQDSVDKKAIDMEPSVIGLGLNHLMIGLENKAWFYSHRQDKRRGRPMSAMPTKPDSNGLVLKKEYQSGIASVALNSYLSAILLNDGKLYLHSIDTVEPTTGKPLQKVFPEPEFMSKYADKKVIVTCFALTEDFLIYGTSNGYIHTFVQKEWILINEIKHKVGPTLIQYGIRMLSLSPKGVKFSFIDDKNEALICNPASSSLLKISGSSGNTIGMLWNRSNVNNEGNSQRNIFVVWDNLNIITFAYQPFTVKGVECVALGFTRLPYGLNPVNLINGDLSCLTPSGKLTIVPLVTTVENKETIKNLACLYIPKAADLESKSEFEQGKALQTLYSLGKLSEIWPLLKVIKTTKPWVMLADAALHCLDISTCKRIYRQILSNAGMVLTLEELEWIDDRNLIAGHVSALMGNISAAQDFFLKSSNPLAILELRRDLMHWEQALNLAQTLAPHEVTFIAKDYAHKLEFDGI